MNYEFHLKISICFLIEYKSNNLGENDVHLSKNIKVYGNLNFEHKEIRK